jgi:dipeptidase
MLRSCDTMVALGAATAHGQTLFAKNSDRPADECQPLVQRERCTHPEGAVTRCQFVELPEVRETWRHVGSRPYWCWGYEHGFNEHQVVIGNEGLASRIVSDKPKLIGMELLRLGLERARTAAEAVEVMTDLVTRYGQGKFDAGEVRTYDNGYIVADPREAYLIETAGHHWAVRQVQETIGISNVYSLGTDWARLSADAEATAVDQGWWEREWGRFDFARAVTHEDHRPDGTDSGSRRRARSCAVLRQQAGRIDAGLIMALLGDHSDGADPEEPFRSDLEHRGGICIHSNADGSGGNTAASLVADLCADGSRLPVYWCSFYSPCLGVFFPVFIEGTLPAPLVNGGAEPTDDSPWWLFHRLSRVARAEPVARIPAVRHRWAALQSRLFDSASSVATEGRRLLDAGRKAQAEEMLTAYMAENVTVALREAAEMLRSFE